MCFLQVYQHCVELNTLRLHTEFCDMYVWKAVEVLYNVQ